MKGNSSDNCLVNLCNTRALANKQTITMTDIATFGLKKKTEKQLKSSRLKTFSKKKVMNILTNFTRKYLHRSLFFNKIDDCRPETLLNRHLSTGSLLLILRLKVH